MRLAPHDLRLIKRIGVRHTSAPAATAWQSFCASRILTSEAVLTGVDTNRAPAGHLTEQTTGLQPQPSQRAAPLPAQVQQSAQAAAPRRRLYGSARQRSSFRLAEYRWRPNVRLFSARGRSISAAPQARIRS